MQGAALPAAFAQKIHTVQAVIQDNVRIRTGARIETVQWKRENRNCSMEKGVSHCYGCGEDCRKGILAKIKPYGFSLFAKQYGEEQLLDCLEANEKAGVVYHREGLNGDYDAFEDVEMLIEFIKTRNRHASDESIPE